VKGGELLRIEDLAQPFLKVEKVEQNFFMIKVERFGSTFSKG
jgi:hypothetical protein